MSHLLTAGFTSKEGVKGMHDDAGFRAYLAAGPPVTAVEKDPTVTKTKYRPVNPARTYAGRGQVTTATQHPTVPAITHIQYRLYTLTQGGDVIVDPANPAQPLWKPGYEKTVIAGLAANQAHWQTLANDALYEALRYKDVPTTGQGKFQGLAGGVIFEFWARAGRIDTCYPMI